MPIIIQNLRIHEPETRTTAPARWPHALALTGLAVLLAHLAGDSPDLLQNKRWVVLESVGVLGTFSAADAYLDSILVGKWFATCWVSVVRSLDTCMSWADRSAELRARRSGDAAHDAMRRCHTAATRIAPSSRRGPRPCLRAGMFPLAARAEPLAACVCFTPLFS
ncbi:hypothetical protein GGX14DRAFT_563729 [Mycena pura]|uniref:Uncharacterized protein n=1 Tax=Mycena pura TaxID=153505 RepID=A0AAD6YCD1_9AGAR|nr:hypothetical protein GGX14DRAFT_563729 [Mycena pura]